MHIHSHSTYNIHTYIYNNGQRELNNKKLKNKKKITNGKRKNDRESWKKCVIFQRCNQILM